MVWFWSCLICANFLLLDFGGFLFFFFTHFTFLWHYGAYTLILHPWKPTKNNTWSSFSVLGIFCQRAARMVSAYAATLGKPGNYSHGCQTTTLLKHTEVSFLAYRGQRRSSDVVFIRGKSWDTNNLKYIYVYKLQDIHKRKPKKFFFSGFVKCGLLKKENKDLLVM